MTTILDIQTFFDAWAPQELASVWDNVGIQIGDPAIQISEILIALEVDEAVLSWLKNKQQCLVITHHPLFFKSVKQLRYDQDLGRIIQTFMAGNHQLFSAHTNLDRAPEGVNDTLIKHFNLDPKTAQPITEFGAYLDQPSRSYQELLAHMPATQQGAVHDDPVKRLGFCAGSGHGLISEVINLNIDTFITGEITYHDHVTCRLNNVRVLTLGHKESEDLVCSVIKEKLNTEVNVEISIM